MQVSHTTERGGNGTDVVARFRRAPPMSETASRIGQVFRLHEGRLQQVSKEQVADAREGEVFLLCVSRDTAKRCSGNLVTPASEAQYRNFKGLVEEAGSTMRFYVEHDGEAGNSVNFGSKMWSERVSGTGQSSLMEGFVETADRFYIGVNSSQALKQMH